MAHKYLVLDSLGRPVARCMSPEGLDAPVWRLEASDEDLERILSHKNVTLVGTAEKWAAAEGRIVRHEGNQVWVEPIRELDGAVRENLRMPVQFQSFLYPVSGKWKGRRLVLSRDLSCGGVAFYCAQNLEEGEIAQIVVPVTAQPLLLDLKVLHRRPSTEPVPLYAAEFVDLLREEESMIREAVFNLQLRYPAEPGKGTSASGDTGKEERK